MDGEFKEKNKRKGVTTMVSWIVIHDSDDNDYVDNDTYLMENLLTLVKEKQKEQEKILRQMKEAEEALENREKERKMQAEISSKNKKTRQNEFRRSVLLRQEVGDFKLFFWTMCSIFFQTRKLTLPF